jgi:hypothetical protein
MGTPTQYYVDPSLGSDTGDGSVGTPWGRASGSVIQYALDTGISARDSTNGDQINVKAGTDDVLAATLDNVTNYGAATDAAPLIIRGYTSAANDGGIGGIDGNGGNFSIIGLSNDFLHVVDMHCHNTGTAIVMYCEFGVVLLQCEFDNSSTGLVRFQKAGLVNRCNLHNCTGYGIYLSGTGALATNNYLSDDATGFTNAIQLWADGARAIRNIISIAGASSGIALGSTNGVVAAHNSILSSNGTGKGIYTSGASEQGQVYNNLVEGFSTGSGDGISLTTAEWIALFTGNACYNNVDDYILTGDERDEGDNEELGASPFAKSGADTFANRFTYFAPVDTGNVQGGAYPSGCLLDKGAVQHADPAGGVPLITTRRNSMIGR